MPVVKNNLFGHVRSFSNGSDRNRRSLEGASCNLIVFFVFFPIFKFKNIKNLGLGRFGQSRITRSLDHVRYDIDKRVMQETMLMRNL